MKEIEILKSLTSSQHLFINVILDAIDKEKALAHFLKTKASGKTFALHTLDKILDLRNDWTTKILHNEIMVLVDF